MNPIERVVRVGDRFQQRHTLPAVVFAVMKKYGDDAAGNLVTVLAFSGFLTIFPLLLLLITIVGIVLAGDPSLQHRILDSTFGQLPIVGSELRSQLSNNLMALRRNSVLALSLALVFLVYGSLGLAQNGIYTMEQIWNVPGIDRSNYWKRLGRSLEFLGVLALGLVVTTTLSAFATNSSSRGVLLEVVAVLVSAIVAVGQFFLVFRVLTPPVIETRWLVPGAFTSGVGWTILQAVGTYLVGHTLKNANALYGSFAFILGLIFWISLVARVVVYSCEMNVVLQRRLWPRSIVQPPLTKADEAVLAAQATQNLRRPEQRVRVTFDGKVGPGSSEASTSTKSPGGGSSPTATERGTAHLPQDQAGGARSPGARPTTAQPGESEPGGIERPQSDSAPTVAPAAGNSDHE